MEEKECQKDEIYSDKQVLGCVSCGIQGTYNSHHGISSQESEKLQLTEKFSMQSLGSLSILKKEIENLNLQAFTASLLHVRPWNTETKSQNPDFKDFQL